MIKTLRTSLLGLAALVAANSFAQPAPPYAVTVSGTVAGCSPLNSVVVITSVQGTMPQVSMTAQLDANCAYSVTLQMNSPQGYIQVSAPCNGAVQDSTDYYAISFLGTASIEIDLNCGGNAIDCLGVPGGSAMPGTPCDDGDPATIADAWTSNCDCVGSGGFIDCLGIPGGPNVPGSPCSTPNGATGVWDINCNCIINTSNCLACITVTPQFSGNTPVPFAANFINCSTTSSAPMTYVWWMPDGSSSTQENESYTFPGEGTYGICLVITDAGGCSSTACDTVYVDANGGITTIPNYYDCLQVPNGPNVPGSPCYLPDLGIWGVWSNNCVCSDTTTVNYDCLQIPNGPNLPGTPCTVMSGGVVFNGVWDANCECDLNALVDCMGIPNGPNMPGTPCENPATGENGIWSANCTCVTSNVPDCEAGFWVLQAYTIDSLNPNGGATPIPFELWVWNLSSGGDGNYQFVWDFGDGTTSTDPYPTHVYGDSGPYELCLTMTDGSGCTDTYCETIEVDDDGMLGMVGDGGVRSQLTVNVLSQLPTGFQEAEAFGEVRSWPNPVSDVLSLTFGSSRTGTLNVRVLDTQGRLVGTTTWSATTGHNRFELPVQALDAGTYLLQLEHGGQVKTFRFVKH